MMMTWQRQPYSPLTTPTMHPALLAALAALPLLAHAGMYRDPVVELDARSFKKVMANEHASVSPSLAIASP